MDSFGWLRKQEWTQHQNRCQNGSNLRLVYNAHHSDSIFATVPRSCRPSSLCSWKLRCFRSRLSFRRHVWKFGYSCQEIYSSLPYLYVQFQMTNSHGRAVILTKFQKQPHTKYASKQLPSQPDVKSWCAVMLKNGYREKCLTITWQKTVSFYTGSLYLYRVPHPSGIYREDLYYLHVASVSSGTEEFCDECLWRTILSEFFRETFDFPQPATSCWCWSWQDAW